MRKAASFPDFEFAMGEFTADPNIVTVLVGHLAIEAMIIEAIQLKEAGDACWALSFPGKVQRCIDLGLIAETTRDAFIALNNLRNDFAHIYGHRLKYDDLVEIIKVMTRCGFDFSDDTIHADSKLSEEWYGFEGALQEIFREFYLHLGWIIHENGGHWKLG